MGGFAHSQRDGAPEGVQGAIGKPPGRLRRGEILRDMGKGRKALSLAFHKESVSCGSFTHSQRDGPPEGVQGAIGKPPGRLRRGEILCNMGKGRQALSLAFHKESVSCGRYHPLTKGWAPEGVQGAIGKPPGRLRRGEILCDTGKVKKALFPCLPQGISFLWKVSSACGRTRYFPSLESTQRVPGAAKGCMSHGRPRTPRC